MDVVEAEPLCFADFYAGDLLKVLLEVPESHWDAQPESEARLVCLLATLGETPEELREADITVAFIDVEPCSRKPGNTLGSVLA